MRRVCMRMLGLYLGLLLVFGLTDVDGCAAGEYICGAWCCRDCPYGQYGSGAGFQCWECEAGTYSATKTNTCAQCPTGKFMSSKGASACTCCPAGFANDNNGQTACGVCNEGLYQNEQCTNFCKLCEAGKYSVNVYYLGLLLLGNAQCTNCPAGKSSSSTGAKSAATCVDCAAGSWSAEGAGSCTECTRGKYSGTQGATADTTCQNCGAGKYLDTTGANAETTCKLCGVGKYLDTTGATAETTCKLCGVGKYLDTTGAAAETTCKLCGVGKYLDTTGAAAETTCKSCGAGKYLDTTGATAETTCKSCGVGKYVDTNGASTCTSCGAGKYLDTTGASAEGTCKLCGRGKYLDTTGATTETTCKLCGVGKYLDTTGAVAETTCKSCGVGKYLGTTGATSESTCLSCGSGKYLGTSGSSAESACNKCPADHYMPNQGASVCTMCNAGSATSHTNTITGNVGCTSCDVGYNKPSQDGLACSACVPGKYQIFTGQTFCTSCVAGLYSTVTASSNPAVCTQCPAGKYSGAAASVCIDCVPGKYGAFVASTSCSACNDLPKPRRLYTPDYGRTSCLTCTDTKQISDITRTRCFSCLDGQQEDESISDCVDCAKGKYSDSSTDRKCIACRNGTFANTVKSSACTNCLACPDSFYRAGCSPTVGGGVCKECPICARDQVRVDCLNRAGHSDESGVCRPRKFMVKTALCDEQSTGTGLGGYDFPGLFGMTQDMAPFQCRKRCDGDSNRLSDEMKKETALAIYAGRSFDSGYCKGPFACDVHSCVIFTPSNDWDASYMQASACPVHIDDDLERMLWSVANDEMNAVVVAVNAMRSVPCSTCERCGYDRPSQVQSRAMQGYATWGAGCVRECTETLCKDNEVWDWTEVDIWKKCKQCRDLSDVRLCLTKEQKYFVAVDVSGNLPKIYFDGCHGKSTNTRTNRLEATYGNCVVCPSEEDLCAASEYYATCHWDEEEQKMTVDCESCRASTSGSSHYFNGSTERKLYCQKEVCGNDRTGVTVDVTPHRTCNRRCNTVLCADDEVLLPCVLPHYARCVSAVHGSDHVYDLGYVTRLHSPMHANLLEPVDGTHMFSSFENVLLSVDSVDNNKRRVCVWNADDIVDNDMNPAGISVTFQGLCRAWSRDPQTLYALLPMQNTVTDQTVAFQRRILLNTSACAAHYSSEWKDVARVRGESSIQGAFSGDVFLDLDLINTTNATVAAFVPDDRGVSAVTSISRWRVSIFSQLTDGDTSVVSIDTNTGIQVCDECFTVLDAVGVSTSTTGASCSDSSYTSTSSTYTAAWSNFKGDKFLVKALPNIYTCDKSILQRIQEVGLESIKSHHTLAAHVGVVSETCDADSTYKILINHMIQEPLMGSSGVLFGVGCITVVFSSTDLYCLSIDGLLTPLSAPAVSVADICRSSVTVQSVVSLQDNILVTYGCGVRKRISLCYNWKTKGVTRMQDDGNIIMHAIGAPAYQLYERNIDNQLVIKVFPCQDLCAMQCQSKEISSFFNPGFSVMANNTFFSGNTQVVVMATSARVLDETYVLIARDGNSSATRYKIADHGMHATVVTVFSENQIHPNKMSGTWVAPKIFLLGFEEPNMILRCTVSTSIEVEILQPTVSSIPSYFVSVGFALLSYVNRNQYTLQTCMPDCNVATRDSSGYFAFGSEYLHYTRLRPCHDAVHYIDSSEWKSQPVHTCVSSCWNKIHIPTQYSVSLQCRTSDHVSIMSLTLPASASVQFDDFGVDNTEANNATVVVYTQCRGTVPYRTFFADSKRCPGVCEIKNQPRILLAGGVSIYFVLETIMQPTLWQVHAMLSGSVFWSTAVDSVVSLGEWSQPHVFVHKIHEKQSIFVNVVRRTSYESLVRILADSPDDETSVALDVLEVIPTLSERGVYRRGFQNKTSMLFTAIQIPTDEDLTRLGLESFKAGHDVLNWRRLHAMAYIRNRDRGLIGCIFKLRLVEIDASFSPVWPGPQVGCTMIIPAVTTDIMTAQCHVEIPYGMANNRSLIGMYVTSEDEDLCALPHPDALSIEMPPFMALQQCTQDAYLHAETGECVSCESSDKKCSVGFYAPACEALLPADRQPNCSACSAVTNALFLPTSLNCDDWTCVDGYYKQDSACVPCTTNLQHVCGRTPGQNWSVCTSFRNEECQSCDEQSRPRYAEWTNESSCSWRCQPGYFQNDGHCEACLSLHMLKLTLQFAGNRNSNTFYKFRPCTDTLQAKFTPCEKSYLGNGSYTGDASVFLQHCPAVCVEDRLLHLVPTSYADTNGVMWDAHQCVACPRDALPVFANGSLLPTSAFKMNLTCHAVCLTGMGFYQAPPQNSTRGQSVCLHCPDTKCGLGQFLRTSDGCSECHACTSRIQNNSVFTSRGRVDMEFSCSEECANGYFYEASSDTCVPHSEKTCKLGLEYKVNGSAFEDTQCMLCTDCTGMRQLSACSLYEDSKCESCGDHVWWNSYWNGTDCQLACKPSYTKLTRPERCQKCSLCQEGSSRPVVADNCSHCLPCQSEKPENAWYLQECTWECFDFHVLTETNGVSDCVYTPGWKTSDLVAAKEEDTEVVCDKGSTLENFACKKCETPLGLSNTTLGSTWFWTTGCEWECMPEMSQFTNKTTKEHACLPWAAYRKAVLSQATWRSVRLRVTTDRETSNANASGGNTTSIQLESNETVTVVMFVTACFLFCALSCCAIRIKNRIKVKKFEN